MTKDKSTKARKVGSKRRTKAGGWELRAFVARDPLTGKDRYHSETFHGTEAQAERRLADVVAEANKIRERGLDSTDTFESLIDRYIETRVTKGCKPTTIKSYRDVAGRYVVPVLGHRKVKGLTVRDFEALYSGMSAKGLKPHTVNKAHIVCRGAINRAIVWGEFSKANPAALADRATPRSPVYKVPEVGDVAALLREWRPRNPDLVPLFWLTLVTGARRSQILGLRWRDIDLTKNQVHIVGSVTEYGGELFINEESSKDRKPHWVAIDAATTNLLREHRDRYRTRVSLTRLKRLPKDGFVFSMEIDCSTPYRPAGVSQAWRRFCAAHGMDGARFHDLRHAMITALLDDGQALAGVSHRAGHSQQTTTLDIYSHTRKATDHDLADAMERLMAPRDTTNVTPLRRAQ